MPVARQGGEDLVLQPQAALLEFLELQVDEGRLLRAALRLYLPPLVGVLLGPAFCRVTGLEQGAWPLLGASLGLALGLAVAWRWSRAAVPLGWRPLGAAAGSAA